jgi:hypothetical protein
MIRVVAVPAHTAVGREPRFHKPVYSIGEGFEHRNGTHTRRRGDPQSKSTLERVIEEEIGAPDHGRRGQQLHCLLARCVAADKGDSCLHLVRRRVEGCKGCLMSILGELDARCVRDASFGSRLQDEGPLSRTEVDETIRGAHAQVALQRAKAVVGHLAQRCRTRAADRADEVGLGIIEDQPRRRAADGGVRQQRREVNELEQHPMCETCIE